MSAVANVSIHPSQFPEPVRRALIDSLRRRQINHKFLYDGFKQTRKWLALHQAYSPSRADADCAATYDESFAAAVTELGRGPVHLIGLGCGGGQKDWRLLRLLVDKAGRGSVARSSAKSGVRANVYYTPMDVSVAMVLEARWGALNVIAPENCLPIVCDLTVAEDLPEMLEKLVPRASRLFTFFGMLPNFEPQMILPRLASLVREGDVLLVSANLAPGADYDAGMARILPLYDNELTRDWLMTFLLDLGFHAGDGELRFEIEDDPAASGAKRIVASFHLTRRCEIGIEAERFDFHPGESIRVFFSYRYTPKSVQTLLNQQGLRCREQWITRSEQEGIFLATVV